MTDFKYDTEDEDQIVEIAKENNLQWIVFSNLHQAGAPTLEFVLDNVRESREHYLEDFAEEDEDLAILPPGEQIFRRYDEIKDLAAIAVISAEAAIAAADNGYTFRLLRPNEINDAQAVVEEFESYKALREKSKEGQMKAHENLQKIDVSKLSQGIYKKLESKNRIAIVTQMPAGIFEINPRVAGNQYIAFIQHPRMRNTFHIISNEKITTIDELNFYDPNTGMDESRLWQQFRK